MLDKLKSFAEEKATVDEMVELDAYATILTESFVRNQITVPEWLADVKAKLTNAIVARQRDTWEKELKETERALDSLKTAEEKRQEKAKRLVELKAKLGRQ